MNYRITAIIEVEDANGPGDAITKALSGQGNVKQANAVSIPKRVSSQPVGEEKGAGAAKES